MIYNAYTVYDRKALNYSPPFFAVADGAAVRMFQDLVRDNNTQVGRHPGDFVLYRCGGYDDGSGSLLPVTALQHIVDAQALVPRHEPLPFDPQPPAPAGTTSAELAAQPLSQAAATALKEIEEVRFNGSGV